MHPTETEIKIAIDDPQPIADRLPALGFALATPRTFEANVLLDTPDARLRAGGAVLRLRQFGGQSLLTFKGAGSTSGRHKVREEIETTLADHAACLEILLRLGFGPAFRYEKYRSEFRNHFGTITIDETPIGNFLELEGDPEWIDRTAQTLGFCESDYITKSYGRLYLEYCARKGIEPSHMVF